MEIIPCICRYKTIPESTAKLVDPHVLKMVTQEVLSTLRNKRVVFSEIQEMPILVPQNMPRIEVEEQLQRARSLWENKNQKVQYHPLVMIQVVDNFLRDNENTIEIPTHLDYQLAEEQIENIEKCRRQGYETRNAVLNVNTEYKLGMDEQLIHNYFDTQSRKNLKSFEKFDKDVQEASETRILRAPRDLTDFQTQKQADEIQDIIIDLVHEHRIAAPIVLSVIREVNSRHILLTKASVGTYLILCPLES